MNNLKQKLCQYNTLRKQREKLEEKIRLQRAEFIDSLINELRELDPKEEWFGGVGIIDDIVIMTKYVPYILTSFLMEHEFKFTIENKTYENTNKSNIIIYIKG